MKETIQTLDKIIDQDTEPDPEGGDGPGKKLLFRQV